MYRIFEEIQDHILSNISITALRMRYCAHSTWFIITIKYFIWRLNSYNSLSKRNDSKIKYIHCKTI